ncbi:MAG: hypothetical protein WEF50_16045 [Myxococcota bacterium]
MRKVALVPVQASFTRVVLSGDDEQLQGEVDAARADIARAAEEQVRAQKFEFATLPLDEKTFQSDPELAFQLTLVQVAADGAMERALRGSPKSDDTLSGTRTVLAETDRLARLVDADALLFVRFFGWDKSGGEFAKDAAAAAVVFAASGGMLLAMSQPSGAEVVVCLIDARTGEVLYAKRGDSQSDASASTDPYELTLRALEQLKR